MLTNRFTLLALPLSAASLFFAGCGGGDPAPAGSSRADMRQAALKYAQCMRKHGIDMPDPQFSKGGMSMRIGGPRADKGPKAAMDAAPPALPKIFESGKPPTQAQA